MDNILVGKDLLEEEQEKALHLLSIDATTTATTGFKDLESSPSSSPLKILVHNSGSGARPRTSAKVVDLVLALIRTQYLQARPPQQIKELKNLFEKIIESQTRGVITQTATSTGDQEVGIDEGSAAAVDLSSIRKKEFTSTTCFTQGDDEFIVRKDVGVVGGMKEDLDEVGNKSEKDGKLCMKIGRTTASCGGGGGNTDANAVEMEESGGMLCNQQEENKEKCASSSIIVSNPEIEEVLRGLYDVTIGFPPQTLAAEERDVLEEEYQDEQSFIHPPIQYRMQFAKYIIKQQELSRNWSAPQGSNEENVEDSVEKEETLLLEKWYDGLELLSSTNGSGDGRQVLSEPFYRLYEIKVAHHNHKGSRGTSGNSTRVKARQGVVKIFEHETSFVADGTTGLVTWKASTEFLKWLTSPCQDGGKLLLEKLGEDKEIGWILELGCGCGFLAVALSKVIPGTFNQYLATDGSLAALEKAKINVEANFVDSDDHEKVIKSRVRYEKVDWQNEGTRESFSQLVDGMTCIHGANKGLLLGADIVFDPVLIPDLVGLVGDFLEARAGKAILACTIRNEETMEFLKQQLASSRLTTRIIGRWEDGEILEISLS